MQINKKYIISFLIGALIGGVAIGIIDAKKPKPLFSSAAPLECQHLFDRWNQLAAQLNERPVEDRAEWESRYEGRYSILSDIESCMDSICTEISGRINQHYERVQYWESTLELLADQRAEIEDNNPSPLPPKAQSEWEELTEQIFRAEEEIMYYTELLEEANDEWDEAGCRTIGGWQDELDNIEPLPPEGNESGSGTGTNSI